MAIHHTKKDAQQFREKGLAGRAVLIGSNFLAGVGVMGFVGFWIDKKTGKEPLFLTIGVILGVFWAMYEAIKIAIMISKDQKQTSNDDGQLKPKG